MLSLDLILAVGTFKSEVPATGTHAATISGTSGLAAYWRLGGGLGDDRG